MGGLASVLFLFISVFSIFLASCIKTFAASRLHSAFQNLIKESSSFRGAFRVFRPRAFLFFPFRAWSAEMRFAQSANAGNKKTNRPNWWKLADFSFKVAKIPGKIAY
ncbi:MAG TPA: hypothetical protein VKC53_02380 [Patescibacteria group bacterium]|nr:hypothetical protein [Patescibacteria group bacterium]